MLAEEYLSQLEKRLAQLSPTPWRFDFLGGRSPFPSVELEGVYASILSASDKRIATVWEHEPNASVTDDVRNGEFIADAPAIIAALIAEIRRLKALAEQK